MEPITRKEKYLAKISGEDVQIPEKPITREEMYLNAIAQGGSGGDGYSKDEIDQKIQEVKTLIDTANSTLQALEKSLQGYVKNTDFATADSAGIVKPDGVGLDIQGDDGSLQIHHPTAEEIQAEGTDLEHQALTLDRISNMFNYFGIDDKTTLDDDYVKNSDYATLSLAGAVKVANDTDVSSDGVLTSKHTGIHIEENGTIGLTDTTESEIDEEKEGRLAIHPKNIPHMMSNYGLISKQHLETTYATKEELGKIKIKKITDTKLERPANTNVHFLPDPDGIVINIQAEASNSDYEVIPHIMFSGQGRYATIHMFVKKSTGELISSGALLPDEIKDGMNVTVTTWYITGIPYTTS